MYTFRSDAQESPFHPHRLIYTHSSPQDMQYVTFSKRFKTEPKEDRSNKVNQSIGYGSRVSNKQTPTVNKIAYFDLDLTHLTSSQCSRKEKIESVPRLNKSQSNKEVKKYLNQSQNTLNKWNNKPAPKQRQSFARVNPDSNHFFSIEGFLGKQNLKELWEPLLPIENKRMKTVQNSQNIKYKYHQAKNYHKPQPKAVLPSKKPLKNNDLRVKRIEKTLVDNVGNQYRMTIEKI